MLLLGQVISYTIISHYRLLKHPEWDFRALGRPWLFDEIDAVRKAKRVEFYGRGKFSLSLLYNG